MPHINRFRVNNVKYNFGTQAYDDFIMKPFGHNTLYDLANGGGKSVLMLLILQTVLPNCTLDDKQPIEKLFRTNEGSQTIHSLVEWKLDQKDVNNGFQYMTTGFCAKKATTSVSENQVTKDTAAIEYFNYCIFYREYNSNDIRNLPLVKGKERITYGGLRKYLKELEHDNSLIVKVFDRKGEYQNFISQYGLYESEWEIIRGINKTEGHVRTYFESNYKTTRKVVEDLLIEEIIEKSFAQKSDNDETANMMSKTLLDIKDRLLLLSKKKEELSGYDHQIELLSYFANRVEGMLEIYRELSLCEKDLTKVYGAILQLYKSKNEAFEAGKIELSSYKEQIYLLSKTIESAKYFLDKTKASEMLTQMQALEEEIEDLSTRLTKTKEQFHIKESFNDYTEYLEEKAKKEETEEAIAAIKNKSTGLIDELHCLTYHLKKRFALKQAKLMDELQQLELEQKEVQDTVQNLNQKASLIGKEIAVSDSKQIQAMEKVQDLSKEISEIKMSVGLLIVEDIDEIVRNNSQKLEQLKRSRKQHQELLLELEAKVSEVSLKLAKSELESNGIEVLLTESEVFFKQYEEAKKRVDHLAKVYGKGDYYSLKDEIKSRYKNNIQNIEDKKRWIQALELEIKRMQEKSFLTNAEVLSEIRDYIKIRQNAGVMTGEEYLLSLSEEDKIDLIRRYPFLPYSLVIRQGYEEVKLDERLSDRLPADVILPILHERALTYKKEILHSEYIHLLTKDQTILFDEVRLEKEIIRKQRELEDNKKQLSRLHDQESTYLDDEAYVQEFIIRYFQMYRTSMEKISAYQESKNNLSKQILQYKEEIEQIAQKKRETVQILQSAESEINTLEADFNSLNELSRFYKESKQQDKIITEESNKKEGLLKQQVLVNHEYEELSIKLRSLEGACEGKRAAIKELQDTWREKYEAFYVDGTYKEIDLSDEELLTSLNGKCIAFTSEHTDLEDKKRLIGSYVNVMNRCLKSISQRGISTAMLKELKEAGKLYSVNEQELMALREEVTRLEKGIYAKSRDLEEKREAFHRLDGKTGQALSIFEEKYGRMQEVLLDDENAQQIIERNKHQILQFEHKIAALEKEQQTLLRETEGLLDMRKDMERTYKNSSILSAVSSSVHSSSFEQEDSVRKEYEKLGNAYEKLSLSIKSKQEEFIKNKEKTIEALIALQATGLAEEVKSSVTMPLNEEDTLRLVKNLKEVNECLQLEKTRIERGIEDMQLMKDSFENQCLQRCIHIKTELERLSKLSKIMLDGEQINMLHLSIPYVKDEFVKEKMSGYIDEIVRGADGCEDAAERIKYIRNALSLKKLFSVIVTDMNRIKLTLYKRERIKEQSKHLRYEEAVGSTGQSQGIYIQFLIAIINYISNINSGRTDNKGLLKVIFIDNPFGAAKDVYIWEPIFELLKTNNVQLIVPARGTTPAITGRFDVNYVLGQKIIDGRQQTVVVDYQSRIDASEVEYIPLQFEQTSIDWFEN